MRKLHFGGLLFCLLLLTFATSLRAADDAPDTGADKAAEYRVTEDVVYGHKDGMALTLDVLEPVDHPKGKGLILISSGGWRSDKSDVAAENDRQRKGGHWSQGLLKGGYTLFVVRHGSSPRYRVAEMTPDINRAVRYVRTHAADFKVDPDHLGVTSGSSGGHLSLMAAMTGDDGKPDSKDPVERASSRVQAVVAWFPPTDMINWGKANSYQDMEKSRPGFFDRIFGKVTNLEQQLKDISPIYLVTKNSPPLLLVHGDSDKTVPLQQSQIMEAKYKELDVPVKLIVKPGGGHGGWPGVMEQYPAVWEWFDTYLK